MQSRTVTFFGTSSASPSLNRNFSCIGIENELNDLILLDCGDGSIGRLLKFNVNVNSISNILISHYHSDHVTGLTQIIETMGIKKRKSTLNVFGPSGLKDYFSTVERITNVASQREFQIVLTELSKDEIFGFSDYSIKALQMDHTVPCLGYRMSSSDGTVISYTGDTMPCDSIFDLGRNADLLIHEATFLQKDVAKARPPKHSTPEDAAISAKATFARKLVLTHVSDDCETPEQMVSEAREKFSNVAVASDGLRIKVQPSA